MSLTVKSKKVDGVVVIEMNGRITSGEPQLLLRSTVRRFIDDGNNRFVLNLTGVSHIDTTGLGELVSAKSVLIQQGGEINLVGLTKRVKDLLVMTHLALEFGLFDQESEAVAALQGDRKVERVPTGQN